MTLTRFILIWLLTSMKMARRTWNPDLSLSFLNQEKEVTLYCHPFARLIFLAISFYLSIALYPLLSLESSPPSPSTILSLNPSLFTVSFLLFHLLLHLTIPQLYHKSSLVASFSLTPNFPKNSLFSASFTSLFCPIP